MSQWWLLYTGLTVYVNLFYKNWYYTVVVECDRCHHYNTIILIIIIVVMNTNVFFLLITVRSTVLVAASQEKPVRPPCFVYSEYWRVVVAILVKVRLP